MAQAATTTTLMIKAVLLLSMAASLATVSARPLSVTSGATALRARLRLYEEDSGGGSSTCWESLFALRACTGEVILFFVNGEKYLGPGCCRAVRTIHHYCWANSVFGSLGLTTQEFDILRGYCDATADDDHSAPPSSPPSLPPSPQPITPTPWLQPSPQPIDSTASVFSFDATTP
nr:egg cell-secreted protein 1.1-like [Ipomoea batatas]